MRQSLREPQERKRRKELKEKETANMIIKVIKWEVTSKTQNTKCVWLAAFLNLNLQITIPENLVNCLKRITPVILIIR